jgi:hypothetical protein
MGEPRTASTRSKVPAHYRPEHPPGSAVPSAVPSPVLAGPQDSGDLQQPEPIYGLEVIRRALGLSKSAFYGPPDGPYRTLPIVAISERRRGVRKSDYELWLGARTREPTAS